MVCDVWSWFALAISLPFGGKIGMWIPHAHDLPWLRCPPPSCGQGPARKESGFEEMEKGMGRTAGCIHS